jgi:hypothetical protein
MQPTITTKMTQAIEAILASPAAKEMATEREKLLVVERTMLAAELDRLQNQAGKIYEQHQHTISAAMDAHSQALKLLKDAKAQVAKVMNERAVAGVHFDGNVTRIEAALRESADPIIAVFIQEMRNALDLALKAQVPISATVITNLNTGKKSTVPGRSLIGPAQRALAIREAIAAAEGLKLVGDQSNISDRLAALRNTLPEIGAPRD